MTQEEQQISEINSHIEEYLDYYCGLPHAPGFAVLLKGEWGCGKTWFINRYREKLEQKYKGSNLNQNNSKLFGKFPFTNFSQSNNYNQNIYKESLYVSLNGKTNFAEIESELLLQLFFPENLSKELKIAGSFTTELIKSQLKFNSSTLLKNLTEYFDKGNKKIIIFDDLERCPIALNEILGYINDYIEHQDSKIIILANEDKLLEISHYKDIKEKLIGKTFDVNRDLDAALTSFIREISNTDLEIFLLNNTRLIEDIYFQSRYDNLRSLKQIILDFKRLFKQIPGKAQSKPELLQEILRLLLCFSIEIKRGALLPKNIGKLQDAQVFQYTEARRNYTKKRTKDNQDNLPNTSDEEDKKLLISLKEIIDRYVSLNILMYDPFPSLGWWQAFLDRGKINTPELAESILSSKYFSTENTPNWIRLWNFFDLSDPDFEKLLVNVEREYAERIFTDIGDIKHVTGIFLHLADNGLYSSKNKKDILDGAKHYIDDLIASNQINLNLGSDTMPYFIEDRGGYKSLGYLGKELDEFKEFCSYIKVARQSAIEAKLPQLALELLETMQNDVLEFYRMICLNNTQNTINDSHQVYYDIPIFKYITADKFLNCFLLMPFESQRHCFYALNKRYDFNDINKKLNEELDFLRDIQVGLLEEAKIKKGKPSGYKFNFLNNKYIQISIEKLENSKAS